MSLKVAIKIPYNEQVVTANVEKHKIADVRLLLNEKNVFFEEIGRTCNNEIIINNKKINILELKKIYENWFNNYLSKAS